MTRAFRLLLAALLMPVAACAGAAPASYTEGKQYKTVREEVKPADSKRISVQEVFWYGCPHCFHADPSIEAWRVKKHPGVDFERIPNTLGRPEGELHMRAFYVAEALGVGEKIHKPLFAAIHEQHLPMNTPEQIRSLFLQVAGVQPADFDKATSSFMVDSRMRRAEQLSRTYGIASVPVVVVGGKYYTSAQMAGGFDKAMDVVDFLIEKVRQERK